MNWPCWGMLLFGVVCSSALTYLWTVHFHGLNAVQERIRAEGLEAREHGKRAVLDDLHIDREVYVRRGGLIRKRKSLVISERVMLGNLPITPFYETERLYDEELDAKELQIAADAARTIAGWPSLGEVGVKVLNKGTEHLKNRQPKARVRR